MNNVALMEQFEAARAEVNLIRSIFGNESCRVATLTFPKENEQ